jgi:hypothetical protein
VLINGSTIGHTDDTDLLTLASGVVTVAGEISTTTLDIGGTNVTSTAAELNILDGVTSTAAELNILDGVTSTTAELNILDGVTSTAAEINLLDGSAANSVVNSKAAIYGGSGELAGTLSTVAQTNVTSVGALAAGTISSGFGNIDNGSSTLDTGVTTATTLNVLKASSPTLKIQETGEEAWAFIAGSSGLYVKRDGSLQWGFHAGGANYSYGTLQMGNNSILDVGGAGNDWDSTSLRAGALAPTGTITHTGAAHNHELGGGGGAVSHLISNTGTAANDVAYLELKTAGTAHATYTAPHIRYTHGGSTYNWYTGVDLTQYETDTFYIGAGTTVGSTYAVAISRQNGRNVPGFRIDPADFTSSGTTSDVGGYVFQSMAHNVTWNSNPGDNGGAKWKLNIMQGGTMVNTHSAQAFTSGMGATTLAITPPSAGSNITFTGASGINIYNVTSAGTTTNLYGIYMDNLSGGGTDVGISMQNPLVFRGTAANHIENVSQISFPATQSASTDANTLDDYEEGTWTPGIADDTGDPTSEGQAYTYQVGTYVKIGRTVYVQGSVIISDLGTMTAGHNFQLRGLPFTSVTLTNQRSAVLVAEAINLTIPADAHLSGAIHSNKSFAYMNKWTTTGGSTDAHINVLNDGASVHFSAMYRTAT